MAKLVRTFFRILHAGTVNFLRNISLALAAMAVMIVTLTIVLISIISNATFSHTVNTITDKIDVSVYLRDDVTADQSATLVKQIEKLPNVKSAQYLSKDQVLQQYLQDNKNNQQLQLAIGQTDNPLPATIHIKPRNLNQIDSIKTFLDKDNVKALQSDPPSYSGDLKQAIDNITHATNVLRTIGVGAVIIFAFISALIIFNTIQMAIFNRRDEISIMRLLGASRAYIRGPFIVESAIYGALAAVISILIINSIFVLASSTLQATSFGLLDISYAVSYFDAHFWLFLAFQLGVGILIGMISADVATHRYLRFKTR